MNIRKPKRKQVVRKIALKGTRMNFLFLMEINSPSVTNCETSLDDLEGKF